MALYSLIGTTYGGNGSTTFGLPDMRGRLPVHQGQAADTGSYTLGQQGGSETVTLNPAQMPMHSHPARATTAAASTGTVGNTLLPAAVSGDTMYVTNTSGATPYNLANASIGAAGGNQAHPNTMPTLTLQYCIASVGVYPTRD
jgi:microcystin-dependent protein